MLALKIEKIGKRQNEKCDSNAGVFNQSHKANKYVVVGHWPVVNYSEKAPSNNPVIDKEKRLLQLTAEIRLKRQDN